MDYSLSGHYLGYSLSRNEILLSVFTLTSIPLGKRHYELAKVQPGQWCGHTVLSLVHCTPLIGLIAAVFEYALTFMLLPMRPSITWTPIANHRDLKSRVDIPTDPLRPFPSALNTLTHPSTENRTPLINPQANLNSQSSTITSYSTDLASTDFLISQLYPTLPEDPPLSSTSSEPSALPRVPTIHSTSIEPPTEPSIPTEPAGSTPGSDSFPDLSDLPPPTEIYYTAPAQLLSAAEEFFNDYVPPAPLACSTINTTDLTFSNLLSTLLSQYDGICIGENHEHSSPKYLLATNMARFAQLGVDTLYVEGYVDMQDELDAYFSGSSLELPQALKNEIEGYGSLHDSYYTEQDVLMAAKAAGIRMVGIESIASLNASLWSRSGRRGILRIAAMNYQALLIINRDKATRPHSFGKSIIYAGAAHTSRVAGVPSLGQVYGYPSILVSDRAPSFRVSDASSVPPHSIEKETVTEDKWLRRKYHDDFIIEMDTPIK